MKRAHRIGSVVLACTMAVLACNSDSSTAPAPTTRTYVLQSVDGLAPPVVVTFTDGSAFTYVTDTAFLYTNQTWKQDVVIRTTVGGTTATSTLTRTGTYSQTGNSITLTDPGDNTVTVGTMADGTITLAEDNVDRGDGAVASISKGTTTHTAGSTITFVYQQL